MDFQRQDIFPVPMFRAVYPKAQELKSTIVPTFLDIEKNDKEPTQYTANGYTNFDKNQQTLEMPELEDLRNFIGTTVQRANQFAGLKGGVYFTGSWFSINRQHSYHERHNHLPDVWSGVYYVQADHLDSGLSFTNSNTLSNWPGVPVERTTDYNSPVVTCGVETGVLYIFPSYLWHSVDQQKIDQERITIAFNMRVAQNDV